MQRRSFIKIALGSGVLLGVATTGGYLWLGPGKTPESLSIDDALRKLNTLAGQTLSATGKWSPYQIFSHCAQSIEYSMQGFPEHKSTLFKNTLGKLAFSVFSTRGKMTHNLAEPIPSAPPIEPVGDVAAALARLQKAFTDFARYEGKLRPHFAYGELTQEEYALAHVMHLNNHWAEIRVA